MSPYRLCVYKSNLSDWWIINIFDASGLLKVYPMCISKEEAISKGEAFIDGLELARAN